MLNADQSFRRIKSFEQIPQFVEALHRHAHLVNGLDERHFFERPPRVHLDRPRRFARLGTPLLTSVAVALELAAVLELPRSGGGNVHLLEA